MFSTSTTCFWSCLRRQYIGSPSTTSNYIVYLISILASWLRIVISWLSKTCICNKQVIGFCELLSCFISDSLPKLSNNVWFCFVFCFCCPVISTSSFGVWSISFFTLPWFLLLWHLWWEHGLEYFLCWEGFQERRLAFWWHLSQLLWHTGTPHHIKVCVWKKVQMNRTTNLFWKTTIRVKWHVIFTFEAWCWARSKGHLKRYSVT